MKCIPEEPEFGDGQLAEKLVWEALKRSLPEDAVLAHSVQVRNGSAEHEIDLLVLWPGVGLAAIEVKGGQVTVENGQWYQSDRSGPHKIQSPLAQSQGSAHAFKTWIGSVLGTPLTSRLAYLVSLPYTAVPQDWAMAGTPRALILDQKDSLNPGELVRKAIEQEGGGVSPLAPAFMERVVRQLAGNLGSGGSPAVDPRQDEDEQDNLTERQKVLLQEAGAVRLAAALSRAEKWVPAVR
jgi:hypothetical protein